MISVNYKLRGMKTKKIYDTIREASKPVSIKEIMEKSGVNYNTVRGAVQRLLKQGLIRRVNRGVYEIVGN